MTRPICWLSTTTTASGTCCRASSPSTAIASRRQRMRGGQEPHCKHRLRSLVLDVMMPGENGFDLAAWLRTTSDVPILMLTARADASRPGPRAWRSARTTTCRSLSSRANCCCGSTTSSGATHLRRRHPPTPEFVRFGPFTFRIERGELRQGEEMIRITEREREMLGILAACPGDTVPREALAGSGDACERAHRRRSDQPAAPQDRARSRQSRAICRRCAASAIGCMVGLRDRPCAPMPLMERPAARRLAASVSSLRVAGRMPKGLYARSLIIIIAPMVLLQSVVAFVFMERHWQTVTQRLSAAVPRHRGDHRHRRELSAATRITQTLVAHRAGPAEPRRRHPAARTRCRRPGRSRSSRSSTARSRDEITASRSAGRSGSIRSGSSNIVEIRIQLDRRRAAHPRPPQPGLCVELAHLPVLDGRHLARAAR